MARTIENDPTVKSKFRLTIPGLPAGIGFAKVSGLKREIGVVEHNESGFAHTRKLPGREKVDPLVCERGVYANKALEELYRKSFVGDPNMRQTIIVESLDAAGNVARTWKLAEAWVNIWEGPDFDAGSDDLSIEKLTIQFEYYID